MSILEKYEPAVREAITLFWNTRDTQIQKQIEKNVVDRGMRAAVTGGKQHKGISFPAILGQLKHGIFLSSHQKTSHSMCRI